MRNLTKEIYLNKRILPLGMQTGKISTGSKLLDNFLSGGYETDSITTIYGPSGSGKTNLCILAAIAAIQAGKKVIYVDTEGGISVERLKQLSKNSEEILEACLFLRPTSFREQKECFEKIKSLTANHIGLIIIDTLGMHYRVERGQSYDPYETDSSLGAQIAILGEIARKQNIPVMISNQVYDNINGKGVKMVGGNLLIYASKCLIELTKLHNSKRIAILRKHRSLPEDKECCFQIVDEGIKETRLNQTSSPRGAINGQTPV